MAEYTREWKFRAWDPENKVMFSPEDLEEPDVSEEKPKSIYGQIIDGRLKLYNIKQDHITELVPMQSTNWYDQEQFEIFEGDIVEIQGTEAVVKWDFELSGYMLIDHEDNIFPGGAYLTDVIKVKGNVYQDKGEFNEKIREMVFRAWDPVSKKMHLPEDLKDPTSDMNISVYGYLSFGALYVYDFINDPPTELIPMQYTGWIDAYQQPIFEGDIARVGGDIAQVAWSDEIGQFIFVAKDGSLFPGSAQTAVQSEVIGNIYETPDVVPEI